MGDFPRRRLPTQNLVHKLQAREAFQCKPGTHLHAARDLYCNIFPNFTVINVEKPPCFLRKFSPDGQHFIAFSADQASVEIYRFQGPAAAEDLLYSCPHQDFLDLTDQPAAIHGSFFDRFFKLVHVVTLAALPEILNRECSLFTDGGNYLIVGSACFVPEDPHPFFNEVYRNNESVAPNLQSPLENYTLYVVSIETGIMCDKRTFKCDKIFLSNNQGIYLYKDILAVLSIQHQTIHIYQLGIDGTMIEMQKIGRFCYEDDEYVVTRVNNRPRFGPSAFGPSAASGLRPFFERTLNSLKHRLLAFLFKRAHEKSDPEELRRFYMYFDQFKALRMWKMQLLDESTLLIKYASENAVTLRELDPGFQQVFFVVYHITAAKILAVYEKSSDQLLSLFENFCDMFRNAISSSEAQFTCSPSSNVYARQIQDNFMKTITYARHGCHTEAVTRLLAQLPISAQSYSNSPYLDLSLFNYDQKWISLMERPKICGDHPVRFYGRKCGLMKFMIYTGSTDKLVHPPNPSTRRLVAFTFHPSMPFAISVQRNNAEYIVNFHIRHSLTK